MPVAQFLNRFFQLTVNYFSAWINKADRCNRIAYLLATLVILSVTLAFHHHLNSQVYVVYMDGAEIGAVEDPALVNLFVDDLVERCGELYGMELHLSEKIDVERQFRQDQKTDSEAVSDKIRHTASFYTTAYLLHIDGRPFVPLASPEQVEDLQNSLKDYYAACSEGENLHEVYIVEEFRAEECAVSPDDLYSTEDIFAMLAEPGGSAGSNGTATGFNGNDTTVRSELYSRSLGGLNSDGSAPLLTVNEYYTKSSTREAPLEIAVHVKTVEEVTALEVIPYPVEYIEDQSMYVNESEIVNEGVDGEKEVVYLVTRENGEEVERAVVEEIILEEPVAQVEAVGQKALQASGGGSFTWPVQGEGIIYNGYKPGHQAIDIHIAEGTNVLAAADGVVTFNGWGGTQGNYLIIQHGEYWTLYLHNSVNLVSQGERVKRGQVIGKVGATGRASGSHLHFEVRVDDGTRRWDSYYQHQPVNPLQFYNGRM
jgi:murein DD-endopeptidase MepM/ murein hydrolase activator NlpD